MDAFTVDDLIACYQRGVFPMADAREDESIFLIDPERRGVLPLDGVHISRRLARTVRAETFEVRIDSAFDAVVEACATSRPGRLETWINAPIQQLYGALFARGLAHSVECWRDGADGRRALRRLAGRGVLRRKHVFHPARRQQGGADASGGPLKVGGFKLLDTQFITDHLMQFGALEISRADYRRRLARAWPAPADFYGLPTTGTTGADVLQAISQAS
jgi:leucyl/phenylalanyl-tRNA--protein transferase